MIEIYFDGTLINSDDYMAFSYSYTMFDDVFYLGSTASVLASLKVPKTALKDIIDYVIVKVDGNTFMTLVIDELDLSDDTTATLKLTDKLIDTQTPYDFSSLVPISAKSLLENICSRFEIDHDPFVFDNQDVVINSYDDTIFAREYISQIAELAGCYAIINNVGKLELRKYLVDTSKIVDAAEVDSYKINESIEIERVVYDNGIGIFHEKHRNSKNLCKTIDTTTVAGQLTSVCEKSNFHLTRTGTQERTIFFTDNTITTYLPTTLAQVIDRNLTTNGGTYCVSVYKKNITAGNLSTIQVSTNKNVNKFRITFSATDTNDIMKYAFTTLASDEHITNICCYFGNNTGFTCDMQVQLEPGSIPSMYERYIFTDEEISDMYTTYLNPDNLFLQVINESQFDTIANNIIGFKFTNLKVPNSKTFYNVGSQVIFKDLSNNLLPILSNIQCNYFGSFVGSYETRINNNKQRETQVIKDDTKIRRLRTTIDQVSNQLTITAQQTDDNSSSISTLFINDETIGQRIDANTGDINNLNVNVSALIQNADSVGITLKNNSGNNLLTNTQWYLDADTWTKSNDAEYTVIENTEIRNLAVCDRALFLQTGMIRQLYNYIVGQQYTMAFTIKQTAANNVSVRLYRNGYSAGSTNYLEIYNNSSITDWTKVNLTWIATVNLVEVVIVSDNAFMTIFDPIIRLGENTIWSPNFGESRGSNYKFVLDGLYIYDTADLSNYIKIFNNNLTYYSNGTEKSYYGIKDMAVDEIKANVQLNVDSLIVKRISSSPNIYGFY